MAILGGTNGFIERDYSCILFAYTNEDISTSEKFDQWWSEFDDISSVPGISEGIRLAADANQRQGQQIKWKYLVAFGFRGKGFLLGDAVAAHVMKSDSALWFYEAINDLRAKEWQEQDKEEHFLMALTDVKSGREEEFRYWYERCHVPEIVSVSCFRSGRRFHIAVTNGAEAPWKYLALYRFVGPAKDMHQILMDEMEDSRYRLSDALAKNDGAWIYSALDA